MTVAGASRTSAQSRESSLSFLPLTTCLDLLPACFLSNSIDEGRRQHGHTLEAGSIDLLMTYIRTRNFFPEVREKYAYCFRYPLGVVYNMYSFPSAACACLEHRKWNFGPPANPLRNKATARATSPPYFKHEVVTIFRPLPRCPHPLLTRPRDDTWRRRCQCSSALRTCSLESFRWRHRHPPGVLPPLVRPTVAVWRTVCPRASSSRCWWRGIRHVLALCML